MAPFIVHQAVNMMAGEFILKPQQTTVKLGMSLAQFIVVRSSHPFSPVSCSHKDGRLQILCRSKQSKVTQSWSNDEGKTWSPMTASKLPNPNSGTDAITLNDGRQLIVYNHSTRRGLSLLGEIYLTLLYPTMVLNGRAP